MGKPTVQNYLGVTKLGKRAKQTADAGVTAVPIDPRDLIVVTSGDTSFANAEGAKSRACLLVPFLVRRHVPRQRRTQIDVTSIKEMVSREGVLGVPMQEQYADPQTQKELKMEEQMRQWLTAPYCQREPAA